MNKKKKNIIIISLVLFVLLIAYCIWTCWEFKIYTLEARLISIEDYRSYSDSLDRLENRKKKDISQRKILFKYEIKNEYNDTLFFPLQSEFEHSKSHIEVNFNEYGRKQPLVIDVKKRKSTNMIPPGGIITLSFFIENFLTVEDEQKKNVDTYKIISALHTKYVLDSTDICSTDFPVPKIHFNNDTTGVKLHLVPSGKILRITLE